MGHTSWQSEIGHTRLPGTLYSKCHRKVGGKVLRESIQGCAVWQSAEEVSGHSPRLWGWRGWLGFPAGEKRSPRRGRQGRGGGVRILEGNLSTQSGKGME